MDYFCQPCDKVFNGAKPHQDHLNSEKHRKTINEKAYSGSTPVYSSNYLQKIEDPYVKQCGIGYKCILCNMVLNSLQQALSHINGKSHSNLSRKKQSSYSDSLLSNNIVSNPSSAKVLTLDSYIKQYEKQYKCTLCDTVLNSAQQVQSHIAGKYHLSKKSNHTGAVSSSADGSILPENEFTANFSLPMEIGGVLENIKVFNIDEPICF